MDLSCKDKRWNSHQNDLGRGVFPLRDGVLSLLVLRLPMFVIFLHENMCFASFYPWNTLKSGILRIFSTKVQFIPIFQFSTNHTRWFPTRSYAFHRFSSRQQTRYGFRAKDTFLGSIRLLFDPGDPPVAWSKHWNWLDMFWIAYISLRKLIKSVPISF